MRESRHLPVSAALLLGVPLLVLSMLAFRASSERLEDPAELSEAAGSALRAARRAGAEARAPLNLSQAEEAFREGLMERRRQELRFAALRDYRESRAILAMAVARADAAARLARSSVERDRSAVERARATLAVLDGVESTLWLDPDLRRRLQRARTLVSEASSLFEGGAHRTAALRAAEGHLEGRAVAEALRTLTARYADGDSLALWRGWVSETVGWSARTGRAAIVVDKDEHRLTLYRRGAAVLTLHVELGWNNAADKRWQGDGATPEGRYRITQMKGSSRYHRALLLDYPTEEDRAALAELKRSGSVPEGTRAGGLIEIHGGGGRGNDWTDGCVAVTDAEIEELFRQVEVGTPVTVVGSHGGNGVFASVLRRLAS